MASSTVQTQAGVVLGSPKYMSPEQVLGKSIDQRSDIFSLGVMLYEMLTGQSPFVGDTINAVMYQTMNSVPAPPSTLNAEVPSVLNFIVSKALAKTLEERYQSAKEFADDLRACRENLSQSGNKTNSSIPASAQRGMQLQSATEDSKPVANMGVSNNFDSFGATMRLASMTAPEEAEEVSKTLKITRPVAAAATPVTPKPAAPKQVTPQASRTIPLKTNKGQAASAAPANNTKLILIMVVLLILLGAALIL